GATLWLGDEAPDIESDGRPSTNADGDDNSGTPDDEDGVTLPTLVSDSTVDITVTVTGDNGVLNAWIDWNRDGDWDDADEQVITDLDLVEDTHTISITVPDLTALGVGDTFARFRLSTQSGLAPTGEAPDGEVEDHKVTTTFNLPPNTTDDSYTVLEGGTLVANDATGTGTVTTNDNGVLANDSDPENDPFTAVLVTPPAHHSGGAFTLNADGTFSYNHDGSEAATDSFTYRATDPFSQSDLTTVTIHITPVNDNAPVGVDDNVTVGEGGTVTVLDSAETSVLANDQDADLPDDVLTANTTLVTAPLHGVATLASDGTFSYQHNGSENFTDSFTYQFTDAEARPSNATVDITITPVNDLPTITLEELSRQQGSDSINSRIATVSDAEDAANTLTVTVNGGASATLNGVTVSGIAISPTGEVTADVVADCTASDAEFTLEVTDGDSASATAQLAVTVTANTAPTLSYPNASVASGGNTTVNPLTGPSDNGSITSIVVHNVSPAGFSGTIDVDSDGLVTVTSAGPSDTYTVTIRATDNCNEPTDATFTLAVNTPPVARCKDVEVSAGATCTAAASIDDGSSDFEDGTDVDLTQSPLGPYPLGETEVTLTVTDSFGATDTCTATVTVVDDTEPLITGLSPSRSALWPPNHHMREVTVNYTSSDNCPGTTCAIIAISSNEPIDGTGDGDTAPDWEIIDANHVKLRAERSGAGSGRVYTITVRCTDGSDNFTEATTTVTVDQVITGPKSGSAFKIGSIVNFTGRFADVPGSKHTAQWLFDNLTAPGTVVEPTSTKKGTVSGSCKFTEAGVYGVRLKLTDNTGTYSIADNTGDLDSIVVIYDPNGGYVKGGGSMVSPAGAFPGNPALSGNADFGFVSKYFKSATNPKGETQFGLKIGTFTFHALNFDYLSIAGPKAQFKGFGKVNDLSGYNFILTVIDGQQPKGDKLRLKIWNKTTGQVVYDNQKGALDNADPIWPISDGTIVIQPK
ncbi:MAG: cadherin-like domain-containing protein, partial [Verrucomicrobiales bacterium]|nr:cadherin-like domain-containing protein [Verrucomicrobiales bacterium]